MATQTKDIATVQRFTVMDVAPRDVADMLLAASGGQRLSPFDLDVIKVPSGQGAPLWTVQTIEGEDAVKSLEGIAILQRTVRSYWRTSLEESGGGSPPDCSSQDGQVGRGDPGGDCIDCPMAEFGTDARGRGQACKQNALLFLLRPDSVVPMVLEVPPSSIKPVRNFILRMSGQGIQPFGAVLSFSLQKVKKGGSPDYFEVVPSLVRRLDDAELTKIRALRDALMPVLAGVRIEAE